jgi:hypothetical protein
VGDAVTLTVQRHTEDLTVYLTRDRKRGWRVRVCLSEDGDPRRLSPAERQEALRRAADGMDETGR